MAWADMLNLLEGAPVHIPAPKTHFAEDIYGQRILQYFALPMLGSENMIMVK